MGNFLKTTILLGSLTAILIAIGGIAGGRTGIIIALAFAAVMNLGSWWFSDKIVLKMYKAQPVDSASHPELHSMTASLAQRAGLPMPKLYIIPQQAPNAFATGRDPNNAAVAVTHGLMELMNREEVEGVIAHELAHIKNRDTLTSAIAATVAGAIASIAMFLRFGAMFGGRNENSPNPIALIGLSLIAPLAASVVHMAISRTREFAADADAAKFVGHPQGLINALQKLGGYSKRIPMQSNPATQHMFIVQPFGGSGMAKLFSTHPPIEKRIERLRGA